MGSDRIFSILTNRGKHAVSALDQVDLRVWLMPGSIRKLPDHSRNIPVIFVRVHVQVNPIRGPCHLPIKLDFVVEPLREREGQRLEYGDWVFAILADGNKHAIRVQVSVYYVSFSLLLIEPAEPVLHVWARRLLVEVSRNGALIDEHRGHVWGTTAPLRFWHGMARASDHCTRKRHGDLEVQCCGLRATASRRSLLYSNTLVVSKPLACFWIPRLSGSKARHHGA